jgi:ABC-type antimicrobial peptide transport system permease subunit
MNQKPPFDWFGFWVHFFFGVLIGAGLGMWLWSTSSYATSASAWTGTSPWSVLIYAGISALLCGICAGFYGDRFWEKLISFFRWPWW